MRVRLNPWFRMSMDTLKLGFEAGEVINLRMAKAAFGGAAAETEARLMVTEKAKAVLDAQMVLAASAMSGKGHLGPARALALYRRRVQANQRRLTRKA